MSILTFREEVEKVAKNLGVKFEHLVGRSELYHVNNIGEKVLDLLLDLPEVGIKVELLERGESIIAVLDYNSELLLSSLQNKN